jgi:butyryl-CoA dehydrogenase
MQAFGHVVLAWIWLDVALAVAGNERNAINSVANKEGKLAASTYFYHFELPKIGAWLNVVQNRDLTCADMSEDAF